MRLYIQNYDIYRTGREDGQKGGIAVTTYVVLLPLISVEAPIGNAETFLAAVYKSRKDCGVTQRSRSY